MLENLFLDVEEGKIRELVEVHNTTLSNDDLLKLVLSAKSERKRVKKIFNRAQVNA